MKKLAFLIFFVPISYISFGQYWFGPKIGLNYVNTIYQDERIERDLYDVDNDYDINAGFALNYTANDLYSVYGEIIYERMNRNLRNKPSNEENPTTIVSDAVNHYISVPVMLRVSFGKSPFRYYVNGGPKISYWLASKGSLFLSSFRERAPDPGGNPNMEETNPLPIEYKVTFNSTKDNAQDVLLLSEPNRLQFGLTAGAGAYFDLLSGSRLMLDFRYSFGHSNMGFDNIEDDVWFDYSGTDSYVESFEYSLNTASVSVAYLFSYDARLKRKGRSTNKKSNRK